MPRRRRQDLDVARLIRILEDDQACRDLRLYFGVGLGRRKPLPFAGGRFELLDGGGDRLDICDLFTASDILSIGMLSVQLPPLVVLDLLEGRLGEEAALLLRQIPKRPSLIPVYDDVVRCAYDWPKEVWKALRDALRQDDGSFRVVLESLINRAGIPAEITPLRALDVALWMRHRPYHTGHGCVGLT